MECRCLIYFLLVDLEEICSEVRVSLSLEILLPGVVLVLSFLMKVVVDRQASIPDFIHSSLELPVDIIFLAISMMIAFIISPQGDKTVGLTLLLVYVCVGIVAVVLWRRSSFYFAGKKHIPTFCWAGINYVITFWIIVNAIETIKGR
ncbi:hypothetical protein D3C87_1566190 [compost metagenome]